MNQKLDLWTTIIKNSPPPPPLKSRIHLFTYKENINFNIKLGIKGTKIHVESFSSLLLNLQEVLHKYK